jgi:hypothetical protein
MKLKIKKIIENCVWQTLRNLFLEIESQFCFIEEIKSFFFEVIVKTSLKCVIYKLSLEIMLKFILNIIHLFKFVIYAME